MARRKYTRPGARSGWDPVAAWYNGWVGSAGSEHHRELVLPTVLELLEAESGEHILDIGCGSGVLAPHVAAVGASYTGVDASPRMTAIARRHHRGKGRFLVGDATRLDRLPVARETSFDAAVFMLSIQDIRPLGPALAGAAWALRPGGRLVLLMTHPCFRIPRQSGWGWDPGRRLQFRRVDRYLTPLDVPMKRYGKGRTDTTRSCHRPLEAYVSALTSHGLLIDRLREVPTHQTPGAGPKSSAVKRAYREIPLFLGLRALKHDDR